MARRLLLIHGRDGGGADPMGGCLREADLKGDEHHRCLREAEQSRDAWCRSPRLASRCVGHRGDRRRRACRIVRCDRSEVLRA